MASINNFVEYHKIHGTLNHAYLRQRVSEKLRQRQPSLTQSDRRSFGFNSPIESPISSPVGSPTSAYISRESPTIAIDFKKYDTAMEYLRSIVSTKLKEALAAKHEATAELVDINLTEQQLMILNSTREEFLKSFNKLIHLKNEFVVSQRRIVALICHTPEELDDLDEINEEVMKKNKLAEDIKKLQKSMQEFQENIQLSLKSEQNNQQLLNMMEMEYKIHKMQVDRIDLEQHAKISNMIIRQKDIAISVLEKQLRIRTQLLRKHFPPNEENKYPENYITLNDILKQNRFNRKTINKLNDDYDYHLQIAELLVPLPTQQQAIKRAYSHANSVKTLAAINSNINNTSRPTTARSLSVPNLRSFQPPSARSSLQSLEEKKDERDIDNVDGKKLSQLVV